MKKQLTRLVIGGATLALAMMIMSSAQAACTSDRTFGTYPSAGACGAYCYINSPGMNTAATMEGFYWVLGEGETRNSGGYMFDGTGGSQPWHIPNPFPDGNDPFPGGWSLTTTVNNGQTVGCPSPDPTVFVFSDISQDGGSALYGLAAVVEDLLNFLNYDIGLAGTMTLQPIPDLGVVDVQISTDTLTVDLNWTPNASDAFTTSTAAIPTVDTVVTGWNIYKQEVPAGNAPPTDRTNDPAIWELVGTAAGSAANSAVVTFSCAATNQVFLALAPDLDNGFTSTAYVGGNSTRVECDPNVAEPAPRKQKTIERPKKLRQR
jgi:hypothetical protein